MPERGEVGCVPPLIVALEVVVGKVAMFGKEH